MRTATSIVILVRRAGVVSLAVAAVLVANPSRSAAMFEID